MRAHSPRHRSIHGAAAVAGSSSLAQPGRIHGFDHIALPMQNTDAMLAFYPGLGCDVTEYAFLCSVHFGDKHDQFSPSLHLAAREFHLRAPAAKPPCGDLCFVWEGAPESLNALLDRAGAKIIEGPVARQGGRRKAASSVYIRDPDGNLLEFMIYP